MLVVLSIQINIQEREATSWKKLCPSCWIFAVNRLYLSWPSAQVCGVIQCRWHTCDYVNHISKQSRKNCKYVQIYNQRLWLLKWCCEMLRNRVEEKAWPNASLKCTNFDFYCYYRLFFHFLCGHQGTSLFLSFYGLCPPPLIHVGKVAPVLPADLARSVASFPYW